MNKYSKDLNIPLRELLLLNKKICSELRDKERNFPGSILEERTCPVCGTAEYSDKLNNGYFDFRRCSNCALLYMSPALKDGIVGKGFSEEDEYNKGYWELMQKNMKLYDYQDVPDPAQHPILRDIVPLKKGGRLLDVGCSVGNFLMAARHFYEVEGNEINSATAKIAKSRGLMVHTTPIEIMDGERMYDVVTMNQLFYGLKHPMKIISAAARLLKKDGILYINTPNSDSFSMRFFKGEHCHVIGKTNMNVFNLRSLTMAAKSSGLSVHTFYTEWIDFFIPDLLVYMFNRDKFIHRRNFFLPLYGSWISGEEKLRRLVLGNKFRIAGDYCVCVLKK